jgi:hypothetical protein
MITLNSVQNISNLPLDEFLVPTTKVEKLSGIFLWERLVGDFLMGSYCWCKDQTGEREDTKNVVICCRAGVVLNYHSPLIQFTPANTLPT